MTSTFSLSDLAGQHGFATDGLRFVSTGISMPNITIGNNTLNLQFTSTSSAGAHAIMIGEDSSATSSVQYHKMNNGLIYGNTVIGNASNALYEHGIMIGNQSGGEVYDNTVDYSLHAFISKGSTGDFFHDNIATHSFGEALRAKASTNTKFYNNTATLVPGYASYGMLANDDIVTGIFSSGIDFRNNLIYASTSPSYLANVGTGNTATFHNNGYYSTGSSTFAYQSTTYPTVASWQTAHEPDLVYGDPLFVNPVSNLSLQSQSPMINTGTTTSITADYLGNPIVGVPDIGAYEYQGVPADITPPVISSIASSTTQASATIAWTTNEVASSTAQYGTTTTYDTASTSAALVTSHSITLSGLAASTTYHFQVGGADASGNVSTSTDQTFTTTAVPANTSTGGGGGSGSTHYSGSGSSSSSSVNTTTTTTSTGTTSTTPAPTISRNLTLGLTGDDVMALQRFLIISGFTIPAGATGYFGAQTVAALAQYQASHGIVPASGYFGPLTRSAMSGMASAITAPTSASTVTAIPATLIRDLHLGSTGEDVRALQHLLNQNHFTVSASGTGSAGHESTYFGPATRDALIRLQTYFQISPAQGYFGERTRMVLQTKGLLS